MSIEVTSIEKLDRNRVPVTFIALVRAVRPAPQALVSQEGLLEDETGKVPFTVWKDSGISSLRAETYYVFHRVGLGIRDGQLEVRIEKGSQVFPSKTQKKAARILDKLEVRESLERQRLARSASGRGFLGGKMGFYSILITLALVFWGAVVALHFSGVLGEREIRDILEKIGITSSSFPQLEHREGQVIKVIDARTVRIKEGGQIWIVHYKGLAVTPLKADGKGRFPPLALKALNYNRYLVRDRKVTFEFSGPVPENKEVWGYVFLGDEMVNASLLGKGLAWLSGNTEKLFYQQELVTAEEGAKLQRLGIWREREIK